MPEELNTECLILLLELLITALGATAAIFVLAM